MRKVTSETVRYIVSAALILVGLIHCLPLAGVLGAEQLASMYGIAVEEPNLLILMRHRAVLFGILGALLILAAFMERLQVFAFVAGFLSVVSFLALAGSTEGFNADIGRVVTADLVALALLSLGLAARIVAGQRGDRGA